MIDGFLLKKLVSVFVHIIPGVPLLLLITIIGRKWLPGLCQTLSFVLCAVLITCSMPPVSNYFVSMLEDRFPILQTAPPDTGLILVLGWGNSDGENRPPNSVLRATALSRLAEAVRLWNTKPDAKFAVSGAALYSPVSHAEAMRDMAIVFGVPKEKIVVFDRTLDTSDEIKTAMEYLDKTNVQSTDQDKLSATRLVVVSSATHLTRAAIMLDHHQAIYTVAPTDFLTGKSPWYRFSSLALDNLDRAVHEWVGILWFRLRQYLYPGVA